MTPILVALILASPVPIADTISAADEFIKEAEWGVLLPDPIDLLKDMDRGSTLFDGIDWTGGAGFANAPPSPRAPSGGEG